MLDRGIQPAPSRRGCTFSGTRATTGSAAARGGAKVSRRFGAGSLQRAALRVVRRGPEDARRAPTAPDRLRAFDCGVTAVLGSVLRPRASTKVRSPGCAEGRWRISRHSTRPVLKHGPRSLTCARVMGTVESRRRNESEGRPRLAEAGSRRHGRAHCRPVSIAARSFAARVRLRGGARAYTLVPERW